MTGHGFGRILAAAAALMAVALAACGQGAANAHVSAGRALLRSRDFRQAEAEFQAALSLNPQSATTYTLLGITENSLNEYQRAISAFHSALRIDPDSIPAHYNLALSLLRLRQDDDAIHELKTVVRLSPRFESALYNLGLILQRKGRFQESIQYLDAARVQRPGDPAVIVGLVKAYFRTNQREKALLLAKKGIGSDSSGDLSAKLGALLLDESEYNQAVSALEKSRTYAPHSASRAIYLAKAYLGAKQPARAIELLKPFREGSLSWEVYDLLGIAHQAAGQVGPASKAFQQAILLKPDNPRAHFDLGTLLLGQPGDSSQEAGAEEIEQALRLDPTQPDYYEGLGQWLLEKGHLRTAVELLQRGIQNTPPSAGMYLMLAVAKIQLNGASASRPLIDKALALKPHDGPAIHLLGKCFYLTGDYRQAAKYFTEATRLSPQDAFFYYDAAIALERLNKVHEAIPYAQKSVQLDPSQAIYHYRLGKLYAKTGRRTEAVKELETCVRLDPRIDSPYYLLARTYRQMGDPKEADLWSQKLQRVQKAKDKK